MPEQAEKSVPLSEGLEQTPAPEVLKPVCSEPKARWDKEQRCFVDRATGLPIKKSRKKLNSTERSRKRRERVRLELLKYEELKAQREKSELTKAVRRQENIALRAAKGDWSNFDAPYEASEDEAREILTEVRRVQNVHVVDTNYELGVVAARQLDLNANEYYWRNGPVGLQQAIKAKANQPEIEVQAEEVPGELIPRSDLFALYQFSIQWRHPEVSFDDFLATRLRGKSDGFYFGKEILQKDFAEQPHKRWFDFLPKFDPTLLKPNYTQNEMRTFLGDAAGDCKSRLLVASRNSLKSTTVLCWLVQVITVCPDARCLVLTETKPLAKAEIGTIRSYFELHDPRNPTRFAQYFPEVMIPAGTTSELFFQSPMANLHLQQATVESSSYESSGFAGSRADVIIHDDCFGPESTRTEEGRAKTVAKYDTIQKLLEVGSLGSVVCSTPWHIEDLAATLLNRNEDDPDHPLSFIIDPAWKVLSHAKKKPLLDLVEDDVELLFPERLTWAFLQKELKSNKKDLTLFQSQNLCQFIPSEESLLKCSFDEDDIRRHIKPKGSFDHEAGTLVACLDTATSVSKYADFSCGVVAKVFKRPSGEYVFAVVDLFLERLKSSELAIAVARLLVNNPGVQRMRIEKSASWEFLGKAIVQNVAMFRGQMPQVRWTTPNHKGVKSKAERIKKLELLFAQDRLYFAFTASMDEVVSQFVKFDGIRKSSGLRHDDAPDCIAMATEMFLPNEIDPDKNAEMAEAEEAAAQKQRLVGYHQMMFGDVNPRPMQAPEPAVWRPVWPTKK